MKRRCLIVIQNLSKSGSPLTFLHLINSLRKDYVIDVCVTSALDPSIDLVYLDTYEKVTNRLFLLKIHTHNKINRLFPYFAYREVIKIIRKHSYDVVVSNAFEVAALINYKKINIKNVFYSLDTITLNSKYKIVNYRKKRMLERLKKVDLYLSLTEKCLLDLTKEEGNTIILTDFPDIPIKKEEKLYSSNGLILGTIGYFCEKKNQLFSLQLLNNIVDLGIECKLYLMGYNFSYDSYYLDKMESYIIEHHLEEKVIFLDKDFDKIHFFDLIDMMLAPSLYEGLGLVALESQYRLTPCILSDNFPSDAQLGLAKFISLSDMKQWVDFIVSFKGIHLPSDKLKTDMQITFETKAIEAFKDLFVDV